MLPAVVRQRVTRVGSDRSIAPGIGLVTSRRLERRGQSIGRGRGIEAFEDGLGCCLLLELHRLLVW